MSVILFEISKKKIAAGLTGLAGLAGAGYLAYKNKDELENIGKTVKKTVKSAANKFNEDILRAKLGIGDERAIPKINFKPGPTAYDIDKNISAKQANLWLKGVEKEQTQELLKKMAPYMKKSAKNSIEQVIQKQGEELKDKMAPYMGVRGKFNRFLSRILGRNVAF